MRKLSQVMDQQTKKLFKSDRMLQLKSTLSTTKIVILGGTGQLGRVLVSEALNRDYDVTVLVRNPAKFSLLRPVEDGQNVLVAKVDIFDASTLTPHLQGVDAVFSCLGTSDIASYLHCDFYSRSVVAITTAMRRCFIKRLILVTSWCTGFSCNNPHYYEFCLKPLCIGAYLRDMAKTEQHLVEYFSEKLDDITFTVVKSPALTNGPASGRNVKTLINEEWVPLAKDHHISREDVACFMLDCLLTSRYDDKCVAIGV